MKRKSVKAITAILIMTMLSGCGGMDSPKAGGTAAQGNGVSGAGVKNGAQRDGTDEAGGGAGDGEADPQAPGGQAPKGAGNDTAQAADGKPALPDTGPPQVYYEEELYTEEENILSLAESASAWGISYKVEKAEYTESFGDRNPEHLENIMSGAETDSRGNLSGDFKYLFLTITFTNTTDGFQEINRNAGEISVIGASLNTLQWSGDVAFYDTYWEEGGSDKAHHWGLEPGESVTSEVGWVIESCQRAAREDDTLAERMGSEGPYELYYHVKQYDGDNEGSYFIDLGVKVE